MHSDRKLAKLTNPHSNPPIQFLKPKQNFSKLLILNNNRSISHLILLSKTSQAPSFSQTSPQNLTLHYKTSEKPPNFHNLSPKSSSRMGGMAHKTQFSEFFSKVARKKLETDRISTPNDLHFDISHNLDKPYFKSPPKELSKIDELFKKQFKEIVKSDENRPFSLNNREKDSLEDYKQSLLKEIPSAFSEKNPPGGRLEQQLLKKWLEAQKGEIENRFPEVFQQIHQKKMVYGLVFEELRRQLACSCVEIGDLMRDLWDFQRKSREIENLESENKKKKEFKEIKRDFEEKIRLLQEAALEKENLIKEKQEKMEDFMLESMSKEKTLLKLQESEHQLNKKLSELRKMLNFLRKKTDWLTKENENLILKINKMSFLHEKPENHEKSKENHENPEKPDGNHENIENPVSETSEIEDSEEEEKIMIDLKENEKPEEHDINDLNKIIVSSIPEASEIKHYMDKTTDISLDFPNRYQRDGIVQTELTLMDKLFEKNLKNMGILEEMCLDYQYKLQIKDMSSRKFRASVIAVESLIERINGKNSLSFSNKGDKGGLLRVEEKNEEIFKGNTGNSGDLKENSIDSDVFSQRNSLNNLDNYDETVKNQGERLEIEENQELGLYNRQDQNLQVENSDNNLESLEQIPENQEKIPENQEKIPENNETRPSNPLEIILNVQNFNVKNRVNSKSIKDLPKTESYLPSIAIIESPSKEQALYKHRFTNDSSPRQIIKVRPSQQSSIRDKSLDLDFEKVIELFKTENVKAQDFEEKYKRNLEVLQVENAQRKKLEGKNVDLIKTIEGLQLELERLRKSRENVTRMLSVEKRRKGQLLDKNQIRDNLSNEIDKIKESAKLRKRKQENTKKRLLETKIPILGQHVTIEYEHQKQNLGSILLEKIKYKKMAKFHNFMHLKLILKQIHMIYFERISQTKENPAIKEQDFASYVYTFFLSLFGLKKIADKRFIILILSIKKHLSFFRVNIFARFLGLLDQNYLNYSVDELNKYNNALDFIMNISTMGTNIINNESDSKFYVPYIRAVHYTGIFADTRMTNEENIELKRDIESLNEIDPKNINKTGIIDFDAFMEKILNKYKILVNRAKTYVINAFAACDLDGNKMCNLQEFLMLNRHIESQSYDEEKLEKIFMNNADIEKDREKNLSFDKFSIVCVEYNLFTDEAQDKYLGVTKKIHLEIKMQEILEIWAVKKLEIEKRFEGLTILSKEEIENWGQIINVLNERITGKSESQLKPTLIAYKMLEEESKRLVESQKKYDEEGEFGDGDDDVFEELEGEELELEEDII